MLPGSALTVRLRAITWEAQNICAYELVSTDGVDLPEFTAGSHIDVSLSGGLTRSYSLVNAPGETRRYVIAVNKDPQSRGGSRFLHESARPGDVLQISPPRNTFALLEDVEHTVLIAGGIGITPIWSMAQRLVARGSSFELHYACRSRAHAAFLAPIGQVVSRGASAVKLYFDNEAGAVPDLATVVAQAPAGAYFYCCGPVGMLDAFRQATVTLSPERARTESFAPAPSSAESGDFDVVLARSGRTLRVLEGMTILETLLSNGISHPYSCTQGICGTCVTRVLDGNPDHRDWVLTDEQKRSGSTMMICCSGSKGERLVLDL